ncbi:hypothetical protein AAEX28_11875 [Lentisphaerota bacterium WC36G]|nr:hypothetical protein LJT99_14710 [Lentisphaerae bacterium WC36]
MKSQTIISNRKYYHHKNKSRLRSVLAMAFTFMLMLLIIGTGVSYKVSLTEEINNNGREAAKIDTKIKSLKREIAYLKIRREELSSWDNIKKKIVQFKLPLKPARYGQIVVIDSGPSRHTVKGNKRAVVSAHSTSVQSY